MIPFAVMHDRVQPAGGLGPVDRQVQRKAPAGDAVEGAAVQQLDAGEQDTARPRPRPAAAACRAGRGNSRRCRHSRPRSRCAATAARRPCAPDRRPPASRRQRVMPLSSHSTSPLTTKNIVAEQRQRPGTPPPVSSSSSSANLDLRLLSRPARCAAIIVGLVMGVDDDPLDADRRQPVDRMVEQACGHRFRAAASASRRSSGAAACRARRPAPSPFSVRHAAPPARRPGRLRAARRQMPVEPLRDRCSAGSRRSLPAGARPAGYGPDRRACRHADTAG